MASRRQRREWRSEFKGLGTRHVTERERRSIWHNEEKAQEARRWLRTQERPLRYGSSDRRACHVSRRHCRRPHWRLVQVMPEAVPGSPKSKRCIHLREVMGFVGHGSQTQFAEYLGIGIDRWNNFERGQRSRYCWSSVVSAVHARHPTS